MMELALHGHQRFARLLKGHAELVRLPDLLLALGEPTVQLLKGLVKDRNGELEGGE
jgi:hypothetical protein